MSKKKLWEKFLHKITENMELKHNALIIILYYKIQLHIFYSIFIKKYLGVFSVILIYDDIDDKKYA